MTLMILRKYAQLPVLDEDGRLRGVVSWESIERARMANPSADLAEATVKAREADRSDDLLDWIGEIYQTGYVFVRDHDLKVCGLVTAADPRTGGGSAGPPTGICFLTGWRNAASSAMA